MTVKHGADRELRSRPNSNRAAAREGNNPISEIIEGTKWWPDKGEKGKEGGWPRGGGTRAVAHLSGSKDVYSAVCVAAITITPKERTTLIDLWLGRYQCS